MIPRLVGHRRRNVRTRGASLIEVLILVALVALGGVAAFRLFGGSLDSTSRRQGDCIASLSGCQGGGSGDSSSLAPSRAEVVTAAAELPSQTPSDTPAPSNNDEAWYETGWRWFSNGVGGFFVDGLWGDLTGLYDMVTDLPGTVSSLWDLGKTVFLGSPILTVGGAIVPNPFYDPVQGERLGQMGEALWGAVKDYYGNHTDRAVGRTIYEVVTLVIAPAKILKAAKAKWLAKAAKTAKVVDKVVDGEKVIDKAVDAEKVIDPLDDAARIAKKLDDKFGKPEPPAYQKPFEHIDDDVTKPVKVNPTRQTLKPGQNPNLDPKKEYIWVVDKDGKIIVGEEVVAGPPGPDGKIPKFGHPTLTDGQPARIGGELRYNPQTGGWEANPYSGRYTGNHPDRGAEQLQNAIDQMNESFPVTRQPPRKP